MEPIVRKEMKLPRRLYDQISKFATAEGSSFSQFMRTAAVERISRIKKAA